MEKSRLEAVLGFLVLAASAAASLSAVVHFISGVNIPTNAILVALLLLAILQWLIARLRYARHAPLPFPRIVWQILFRDFVTRRHGRLHKLRTAVLFAPEGEPYVNRLSAANAPAHDVKLRSLADRDRDEDADPYAKSRIHVALGGSTENHASTLHQLLLNVQGIAIIWTDDCRSYLWAFEEVTRWSRQFPQNPCLVLDTKDQEPPAVLAWARTRKLTTIEDLGPEDAPTWLLLRQSVTRFSDLLFSTVNLSYFILGSWILIAALGGLCYWLRVRERYFSTISSLAANDYAEAATEIRSGWSAGPIVDSQEHYEQGIIQFQKAVNEQLARTLGVAVETIVFGTVSNNGTTCWCEAAHKSSQVNCFTFKRSVISCALENDAVIGWQEGNKWQAWDLSGEQLPMPLLRVPCKYSADPPRYKRLTRAEIVCFPVGPEMTQATNPIPFAGLCISKDSPGGASLMDGRLIKRLLWSNNLLATLPWDRYGANHVHMNCKKVRRL
jgi:hypothetical protein